MGVVRREGDWRLEKRDEGVYEITFRREPQKQVITADAPPRFRQVSLFDPISAEEVGSYSEAEGLFEEYAHGPPPLGMQYSTSEVSGRGEQWDTDVDLSELSPGMLGLGCLIAGALLLYVFFGSENEFGSWLGALFFVGGLSPFVYAGVLFRQDGWREALAFLSTPIEEQWSRSSSTAETPEKTPPPSQKLKNKLFFERAKRHCEYCAQQVDQPHVHHITPRREGGPNDPKNLIVLCPNCHSKADSGAISRSKLRYKGPCLSA